MVLPAERRAVFDANAKAWLESRSASDVAKLLPMEIAGVP